MNKVIMSVAFLLLLVVGGYFADAKFKAQIDGLLGKGKPATVGAVYTDAPVQKDRAMVAQVAAKEGGKLASILESGVVHVSVQDPSKPFYYTENRRAKGFNIDFMHLMFEQEGFKGRVAVDTNYSVDTYADVPKQLLTNTKVDIAIDGLTFNDEDLPGVVYTIPYVKDFGYSLITAKGTTVQHAADTTGMKIGVLNGDPDAKAFVEGAFPGAKIVELSDKADANGKWIVGHINTGKVDAVVYDYPFAVAEVDNTNLQFAMTKIKGSDIQYRIGVRKEDMTCWVR